MIQFYVLALIFMLYGAAYLLADEYGAKFHILIKAKDSFSSNTNFTIVLIVLTGVVGILKLISPNDPGPIVIGDLLPAGGLLSLSIFYYFDVRKIRASEDDDIDNLDEEKVYIDSDFVNKAQKYYYKNKKMMGYFILGIALFHFLFPGAVLL